MTWVSVWILGSLQSVTASGDLAWQTPQHVWSTKQKVAITAKGRQIQVDRRVFDQVVLRARSGPGVGLAGKWYPGTVTIRARGQGLEIINRVEQTPYVAGTLAAEMDRDWPIEALCAQAIATRTFALTRRHETAQVCDTTHCQLYRGWRSDRAALQAAQATAGTWLAYDRKPAETLYASTCGGIRRANHVIFGGRPLPYLQGGPDPHCRRSPHWGPWCVVLDAEDVTVQQRDHVGLPVVMAWNHRQMPVLDFWEMVAPGRGWTGMRSLNFDLKRDRDHLVMTGTGLGHGVGMCQWGAREMALTGRSFAKILEFYYPGTRLRRDA